MSKTAEVDLVTLHVLNVAFPSILDLFLSYNQRPFLVYIRGHANIAKEALF